MKKYILLFILIINVLGCSKSKEPFSSELFLVVENYIERHHEHSIIWTTTVMIDSHNLFLISTYPNYNKGQMPDRFFYHHDKMITYYQADSIDRSPVIYMDAMREFTGEVDSLQNIINESGKTNTEIYEISEKGEIKQVPLANKLFNRHPSGSNVIRNTELNEILNTVINTHPDVLYGLYFRCKSNKTYVEVLHGMAYDREQYDGYFFRDGALVVLYGTQHASNILDTTWIKKDEFGIPGYRFTDYKTWIFFWPRPYWFGIDEKGKVEEVDFEYIFDLYN